MSRMLNGRVAASALAAVGLGLLSAAALTIPAAQAAPARPTLTSGTPIYLGTATGYSADAFTQAPADGKLIAPGSVLYSIGNVVYAVKPGAAAYKIALHAPGKVIALAASTSSIFVQVGLRVYAYDRGNGNPLGSWKLSSPVTPITSAGLLAEGNTVWSWTDWATDTSGFEYATVSRIDAGVSGSTPAIISELAYPGDMVATAAGLYFEFQKATGYLGFAPASGGPVASAAISKVDAPMAFWGGFVELLSSAHVVAFSAATLAQVSSHPVSARDRTIAGSNVGLTSLSEPCGGLYCAGATVSRVALANGRETGTIRVPGAFLLLPGAGTGPAVIEVGKGKLYLVRVAA